MSRAINDQEEVKLSITPLIDVTFLLLIFFMCAMKFKTLERKVSAHLPTDKGRAINRVIIPPETKITVLLKRDAGDRATRVQLLDSPIGMDAPAFALLDKELTAIHASPANKDMPGELEAGPEVPHADVVRCLDAFLKAGITEVEFVGTAPPGRD